MRQILLSLVLLLVMPQIARADYSASDLVNVIQTGFKTMPNVKEGVFVDFDNQRGLNLLGIEVVNGSYFGAFWGNFALDADYIGQDGLGGSFDVNLNILPKTSFPLLSFILDKAYIGYGAGWRTLTTSGDEGGNPSSDNRFIKGVTAFVKFNF